MVKRANLVISRALIPDKQPKFMAFRLFTSESVSQGHPDKVADQISDAVLDAHLAQDANARVACETMLSGKGVVVAGEYRSNAHVDLEAVVRTTLAGIGYDADEHWYNGNTCNVLLHMGAQSQEIAEGVDERDDHEQGAGDQGMMFGFACDETEEFMPAPIAYAHRLMRVQSELRRSGELEWLGPDAKSQVTFEYQDGEPKGIECAIVSTLHDGRLSEASVRDEVVERIIKPTLKDYFGNQTQVWVNPSGSFTDGGPRVDAGLTGRKIIVDTYGGMARHGGGAFSGKDPSKVDRSAAYAARHAAKNIVAAGIAKRCELQVSYAIGQAKPTSLSLEFHGTLRAGLVAAEVEAAASEIFDMRPKMIVERLALLRPIYSKTAAYGHFGRDSEDGFFPWERLDKVDALRAALRLD